jgi:hypothetical protein
MGTVFIELGYYKLYLQYVGVNGQTTCVYCLPISIDDVIRYDLIYYYRYHTTNIQGVFFRSGWRELEHMPSSTLH